MIVFLLWRHDTLAPSQRTCWHALDTTLSHVCERLCTYSSEMGLRGGGGCNNVLGVCLYMILFLLAHLAGQFTGELRRGREVIQAHTGTIDQVWTGCKAFIPKQLGSQSELIEVYLRAFQWRYVNRNTLIRTKTINQLNLLRKWRRKQSAQSVLWWVSLGKQHFKKNMYGTTARRKNKNKTTLNAYWFRQILDKNDDEYATQATFSLSYFDAMTHIMRAEPIPNDVKFHIILGQNWMKTQAKYDLFQKHKPISTSFCACCTKTLCFSHTKYTRNKL